MHGSCHGFLKASRNLQSGWSRATLKTPQPTLAMGSHCAREGLSSLHSLLARAGLAWAGADTGTTAGTPQYMAPEQLAGVPATVQSEIYALGLLLQELYTGKRALRGRTIDELRREHEEGGPNPPSTQLADIDPGVEAVLARCLARDPGERPRSVLEVARALPGGDPLAAALAAGETPSPELVAAAGESEAMAPLRALALAIGSLVLFAFGASWSGGYQLRAHVPLDKHPETLTDRAREIVRQLGFVEEFHLNPADHAAGYQVMDEALSWIDEHPSPNAIDLLKDPRWPAVSFWYRQRPGFTADSATWPGFLPRPTWGSISIPPVTALEPAPIRRGELNVWLDLEGRLTQFNDGSKALSDEPPRPKRPTGPCSSSSRDWTPPTSRRPRSASAASGARISALPGSDSILTCQASRCGSRPACSAAGRPCSRSSGRGRSKGCSPTVWRAATTVSAT